MGTENVEHCNIIQLLKSEIIQFAGSWMEQENKMIPSDKFQSPKANIVCICLYVDVSY